MKTDFQKEQRENESILRFRKKWYYEVLKHKQIYLILLPFVIYVAIFNYAPLYGLLMAFQDYNPFKGVFGSEWIGFDNFVAFFSSPYLPRLLKNTFMISLMDMCVNFPLAIIFALLLNEIGIKKIKSTIQTIAYMPNFISSVVVAGLVIAILSPSSGVVNLILAKLGFDRIYFLTKPEMFRWIYVLMCTWQGMGFSSIIYTSAISGVDESLYEAAHIDGAGLFKRMWHITLPGIAPTIVVTLIMRMGSLLNVGAESIFLLYQPVKYETADVISTYVYRVGMVESNYSYSTAVGLFNTIAALILVSIANKASKKYTDMGIY